MEEHTLKTSYNKIASEYLFSRTKAKGLTGFQNRNMERPMMFSLVPKNLKNKKLLDIGCGPGVHIKEYSKRGANCVGIDISDEMIKLAKKHCPQGEFYVGSAYKLNVKNNTYDIVTASLLLDHIKDINKAIKEIKRVLKKNGLLIFSVPHPITNVFRDTKKKSFILTNSYYDKKIKHYNISGSGLKFPGYPRILEEYFQALINQGFSLEDFRENQIKKSWKKQYPEFTKIPHMCFFVWKKD
jgi:ubiquinone/menaquinone biosynthesis C-methylase UbiE